MKRSYALKVLAMMLAVTQISVPAITYSDHRFNSGKLVLLVTPEEAAQPNARPMKGAAAEPSDGPTIQIDAPTQDAEVAKPVPIRISFKENQAPVDVSSLKVTYLKLFSIDITDRVKPYVTAEGINIAQADLPSGSHKVRFSIKDTANRLTERTLKVKIL